MPRLVLQIPTPGPDPDYTSYTVDWPVVPAKGDRVIMHGKLYSALGFIHVIEKDEIRVTLWPEDFRDCDRAAPEPKAASKSPRQRR